MKSSENIKRCVHYIRVLCIERISVTGGRRRQYVVCGGDGGGVIENLLLLFPQCNFIATALPLV